MSKFKICTLLTLFAMYLIFMRYVGYVNFKHPNPRVVEFVKTPVSWVDVGLGFIMGAVVVILTMMFPLMWPLVKREGGGPNGGGNGPKRKIALSIIGRVVSIEEFKRMPPKGPVQLAPTGS